MGHKILSVKLLALCLVLSSCLATVYGASCYQCGSGDGADSCQSKIDAGEAPSCPSFQPHCMKISGQVDGKEMILRSCAELSWETILNSKDTCKKSSEVPNFSFKLSGREQKLDNGMVCICSSDKCNPAGRTAPAVGHIAIFLSTLFFGKMFV